MSQQSVFLVFRTQKQLGIFKVPISNVVDELRHLLYSSDRKWICRIFSLASWKQNPKPGISLLLHPSTNLVWFWTTFPRSFFRSADCGSASAVTSFHFSCSLLTFHHRLLTTFFYRPKCLKHCSKMIPILQKKLEKEPWKQYHVKVMEFINVIKNQLSVELSKEQTDELIINLIDINENLGVSFVFKVRLFNRNLFCF